MRALKRRLGDCTRPEGRASGVLVPPINGTLREDAPNDQLSRAEEDILDGVFAKYGRLSRWEIRDLSHRLPEWQDPQGSCVPISIKDILLHQGVSEGDAQAIVEALGAESYADQLSQLV